MKGAVKEKKDLKADFWPVDRGEDVVGAGWAAAVIARQRRKRQAAEKRVRMKILGGRMAGWLVGRSDDLSQAKAKLSVGWL